MSFPDKDQNHMNATETAAVSTAAASANEDMQARVDDVMKKFDRAKRWPVN